MLENSRQLKRNPQRPIIGTDRTPEKGNPHRKVGAQSRWPKSWITRRIRQKGCQGEAALPVPGFARPGIICMRR